MARLNIAMLAQEAQAQEVVEQQTELEVVGQQAEDAIAEATQQQVEIEQTQQAMDETEEVIQEAEEERQVLEQSQAQGGAEPVAMEALQRAVKRFEKRTGVACSVKSMGLESFASKTTRLQQTKVAMEGAVDYIKKLIKMLMDAVAAVWEKVKAFFEKIWVGAERLAKRARQVEAAAKAAQGKTAPADAKVTTGSVLAYARKDDKAVEGKEFADLFVAQTTGNYFGRKMIEEALGDMIKGNSYPKVLEAAKKPDNKEALTKQILTFTNEVEGAKVADGLATATNKERTLGEYVVQAVNFDKSATWEQISSGYSKLKLQIVRAEDAKEGPKEVKPMSPEDARKVAGQAAGHMDSYKDMRSEQNKIDAELKKILAEAKKLESEKDAPVDQLRVATGFIRANVGAVLGSLVAARSYDINLTKAALDYAAASVKLASGKGAESTGSQVAVV
jgi:hypothetical protein